MKKAHRTIRTVLLVLLGAFGLCSQRTPALQMGMVTKVAVSDGWHPWYEIKMDPEDSAKLIICGTKWDARHNAPFGFVYASSDSGETWEPTLNDASTTWVTEQSCAFGPNHSAYLISEASKVIDGEPHHGLGTTRLFSSSDSGRSWHETIKTGWADWSTSAVSSSSNRLFTFFNATTGDTGRAWGSNVGLLVFSPDGKNVAGPFFDRTIQGLGYQGVFPSNAVALRSGAVVALYYGIRRNADRMEAQLGIVRASHSTVPLLSHADILRTTSDGNCFTLNDSSLAYDRERNLLYVAYVNRCQDPRVALVVSQDEGRTWTRAVPLSKPQGAPRVMANPSLAVGGDGQLLLLWEEGEKSGTWLLSQVRKQHLAEPPTELVRGPEEYQTSNDALWGWMYQPSEPEVGGTGSLFIPTATLEVRTETNSIWRAGGLAATGDTVVAAWSSGSREGMGLYVGIGRSKSPGNQVPGATPVDQPDKHDVTRGTVLLYSEPLQFDSATATLTVCLSIGNRRDRPIVAPVKLEVVGLRSAFGTINALNSANGLSGVGAIWDISNAITGDRIPPGASSNPFCLSFHIQALTHAVSSLEDDLLVSKFRVLSSAEPLSVCSVEREGEDKRTDRQK